MPNIDFNADEFYEAPRGGDYAPMPPGNYQAQIIQDEEKISKSGDRYVQLTVQITDGTFKGRLLWESLNLWHSNEKPRSIARATFASICKAVGVKSPRDTSAILNKTLVVGVGVRHNDYKGKEENHIKVYLPATTQPSVAPLDPRDVVVSESPW